MPKLKDRPMDEANLVLCSGCTVSAMYTLDETIMIETPIPLRILPKNNAKGDENTPTKTHPITIKGEQSNAVFLIPMISAIFPPNGANMMVNKISTLTNQDPWFSSKGMSAKDMVPKPCTKPSDTMAKDALNVPKIYNEEN